MFEEERRAKVLAQLLARADEDGRVRGAAVIGSSATGAQDRWSDVDLFLGVAPETVAQTVADWSDHLYANLGALHHFDLHAGPAHYRAFLLGDSLEIDLGFTPINEWGPRGDGGFRPVFGNPVARVGAPIDPDHLIGLSWHHVLHTRIALERDRPWQALHWVNALRDHVLALASLRFGVSTVYAKGAHLLPDEVVARLPATIPGSLAPAELFRALKAAAEAFAVEIEAHDPALAGLLLPAIRDAARCPQQ